MCHHLEYDMIRYENFLTVVIVEIQDHDQLHRVVVKLETNSQYKPIMSFAIAFDKIFNN